MTETQTVDLAAWPQKQLCEICQEERYFVTDGACRSCHFVMHCEGYE